MPRQFTPGDFVVYRMQKHSVHPGPRAEDVHPAPQGEDYSYHVDKFWIVAAVRPDGKIVARTRRGKEHLLEPDDPLLRKAKWWERLLFRSRFPRLDGPPLKGDRRFLGSSRFSRDIVAYASLDSGDAAACRGMRGPPKDGYCCVGVRAIRVAAGIIGQVMGEIDPGCG
jgi:hypothetical protein